MKLHEILTPKKGTPEKENPSMLRPQHGEAITLKDKLEMARRKFKGEKPTFLKRQAESVEG